MGASRHVRAQTSVKVHDRLRGVSGREAFLDDARTAYGRNDWTGARTMLLDADAEQALEADDLERLAWSCRWAGDESGFLNALERAEVAFVEAGARAAAARMALEQARQHMQMLDESVAFTCFFRGTELLEGEPESPEHAQAMWMLSFTQLAAGDVEAARASLQEARAIARRVGSPGLEAMAVQGMAHIAVTEGERGEVLPLVDEAAALAMRPGVAPIHAGYVYCAVISICRALCDWGRATEWTHMSTRYCERESITGYTGLCRFHQGEIDRLHGQLAQAEERVLRACEELQTVNRFSAAWGYSELVEIRVRRGDLAGAEEALAQAVAFGDDGQPGRGSSAAGPGRRTCGGAEPHPCAGRPGLPRAASAGSSCCRCTCARAWRSATSRRPARASPSSRSWRDGWALLDRPPQPRWRVASSPSTEATPRRRSPRCSRASAPGARSTPPTKPPRRACGSLGPWRPTATTPAPASRSRRRLERWRRSAPPSTSTSRRHDPTLPTRTLRTFLFSDIVESTRLAEAMGDDAWEQLLRWHDRTLRAEFARWRGEEVKHGGDGFFVAFGQPDDGVGCAAAIQRALARHRAEHGFAPIVRIGLHAGEATARDGDYFGSAVTRAARISAAAGRWRGPGERRPARRAASGRCRWPASAPSSSRASPSP